jgi:hypothetical protein
VTCPQVSISQIGDNMLIGNPGQFLLQCCVGGFQGCDVRGSWSLASKDICAINCPSTSCGGAKIDLVCLKAAGTAVNDDPGEKLEIIPLS